MAPAAVVGGALAGVVVVQVDEPVLREWVSAALAQGMTAAELAGDQSVRSALQHVMGGSSLTSAEWASIRAGVLEGTGRAARGRSRLAGSCSHCQAPVWWVETEATGARMPLDPVPHPAGTFRFVIRSRRPGVVRAVSPVAGPPPGVPVYRAHFATCPSQKANRAARRGPHRCVSCSGPLHRLLYEFGEVRHSGCENEQETNERVARERAAREP